MKKGFSLVELLITLIVVSVLLSALAPIITKKLRHKETTLAQGVSENCSKFDDRGRCMLCTKNECTLCTTQTAMLAGFYVDPKTSCDYKACSPHCSSCLNLDNCVSCASGYYLVNKDCVACPGGCATCNSKECLSCNSGYFLSRGKCHNTSCLTIDVGGRDICVERFNAGDIYNGGLSIPNNVVLNYPASGATSGTCKNANGAGCCWLGNGANLTLSDCTSNNGGYSGCTRTVCNFEAAKAICAYHNMRLPTAAELAYFGQNSLSKGFDGLQLCDLSMNAKYSASCKFEKRCSNSTDANCDQYEVWDSDGQCWQLIDDNWKQHALEAADYGHYFARSVRCVKDM